MAQGYDERQARKEYMYEKKKAVLTFVASGLAVVFVIALAVQYHLFDINAPKTAQNNPNFGIAAPCPTKDKENPKGAYSDPRMINIRVLNGTKYRGFAHAVGEALRNRGFNVSEIGNHNSSRVKRTIIYFGKNAINIAYSVQTHFTDAILQLDDRTDKLVDIVLGSSFNNLRPKTDVPAAGATIQAISTCKPADTFKTLPKAMKHQAA